MMLELELELELELMLMLMLMLELDAGWLVVFEKTSASPCAGRINFSCRVEVAGRFTSVGAGLLANAVFQSRYS